MKYLFILLTFACSCCGTKTNKPTNAPDADGSNNSTTSPVAETGTAGASTGSKPVALYFGSMASGPIADDFLKTWLEKFNREEQAKITADKYSACGKEGEYIIVIYKNGLNTTLENRFDTEMKKLLEDEVKRAKAANSSSGSVEIRLDPKVEEYTYCRLGSKKWL